LSLIKVYNIANIAWLALNDTAFYHFVFHNFS